METVAPQIAAEVMAGLTRPNRTAPLHRESDRLFLLHFSATGRGYHSANVTVLRIHPYYPSYRINCTFCV